MRSNIPSKLHFAPSSLLGYFLNCNKEKQWTCSCWIENTAHGSELLKPLEFAEWYLLEGKELVSWGLWINIQLCQDSLRPNRTAAGWLGAKWRFWKLCHIQNWTMINEHPGHPETAHLMRWDYVPQSRGCSTPTLTNPQTSLDKDRVIHLNHLPIRTKCNILEMKTKPNLQCCISAYNNILFVIEKGRKI